MVCACDKSGRGGHEGGVDVLLEVGSEGTVTKGDVARGRRSCRERGDNGG